MFIPISNKRSLTNVSVLPTTGDPKLLYRLTTDGRIYAWNTATSKYDTLSNVAPIFSNNIASVTADGQEGQFLYITDTGDEFGNINEIYTWIGGMWSAYPKGGVSDLLWIDYVSHWDAEPVLVGRSTVPVVGDVYRYIWKGITRYRSVPDTYTSNEDGFFTTYNNGILSGFILSRSSATIITNIAPPVITTSDTQNVAENTVGNIALTATDADTDPSNFVWSIVSGLDSALFTINNNVLQFISAPNFENPTDTNGDNVYSVTVQVYDGRNTTTKTINVTVTDVNDNAPVFTSSTTGSVAEGTSNIYTATTTDSDGTQVNRDVVYSLKSGVGDVALLSINASTGVVTTLTPTDFETKTSYSFTVVATNGSLVTEQAVVISVTDVNDNAPVFTSASTITIQGSAAANTQVYQAVTTDADGTQANRNVVYSIKPNVGDAALFSIDSSTGVVTLVNAASTIANSTRTFTVVATNGSLATELIVTATVTSTGVDASSYLTTSAAAYNSAADGSIIGITQAEWNAIVAGMGVAIVGVDNTSMDAATTSFANTGVVKPTNYNGRGQNYSGSGIPFAFRIRSTGLANPVNARVGLGWDADGSGAATLIAERMTNFSAPTSSNNAYYLIKNANVKPPANSIISVFSSFGFANAGTGTVTWYNNTAAQTDVTGVQTPVSLSITSLAAVQVLESASPAPTAPDPIRAVLVASGVNQADLNRYDALPDGGTMILTTNPSSQAFQQLVRTNALTLSGAYRLNGADSLLDGTPNNVSSNSLAVNTVPDNYKLLANTLPAFAFLNTGSSGLAGQFTMRRSQTGHITTSLVAAGTVFDTVIFPATNYPGLANQFHVFVQKKPTSNVATIDTNVIGAMSGGIALLGSVNNFITAGSNQTTLSTVNSFHRQWQAIAIPS